MSNEKLSSMHNEQLPSVPNRIALAPVVAAVLLLLLSCGSETGSTVAGVGKGGELPHGLQRCESDAPRLRADPAFYRDNPIYVANEQPTDEVRAWATERPDFEGIWLDRERNGWIHVGFSSDAAIRQTELEAEFPGIGVVAVEVPISERELLRLRSEVESALEGLSSWGLSHSVSRGLVEASVPVLDDKTLARLAPLAAPTLCVTGAEVVEAVADGPQQTEGSGWRLLGTDRTGYAYRTGVATTPTQYEALWLEAGLTTDRAAVDFDTEIVIWFGAVYGSSCPIRLDDVIVDVDRQLVHGDFVFPGNPTSCTSDANAEAYVVALPRDRLPAAPFAVQLDANDPPSGAPEERTTVLVDLRQPGSMATPEELVVGFGTSAGEPVSNLVRLVPGLVIEDGYPWAVALDIGCSIDVLGPINGVMWQAAAANRPVDAPPTWISSAVDGLVEAELLLSLDPPALTVTIAGSTVVYEAVPASITAEMICP